MLASKFCSFTTDRIFRNATLPLCVRHLKLFDKTLRCNRSNKSDSNILKYRLNPYDTCKRNAEALVRCSRKARAQRFGKQNLLYKCEAITIVSEFEQARDRINGLIERITKFFNEEKQTIVESLKKETKIDKHDVRRWLKSISHSVDRKLEQLILLDSRFGSEIRITVLRFKDHARNTFIALHCELAPSVKHIESILEEMQTEVSQCLQKAAALTLLCRCDSSPSAFKKCIFHNTEEAEKILERMMQETKIKLNEVKKFQDYVLKCHKEELNAETKYYMSEMQVLSQYLDDCLASLIKQIK